MRPIVLLAGLLLSLFLPVIQAQEAGDRAYDLAAGLHDRGLHARAAQAFRDFLERWPQHPRAQRARFHLGDAHLAADQLEEALTAFDSYLGNGGGEFERQARYGRGDLLQRLGRDAEAAQAFLAAVGSGDDELGQAALHFAAESLGRSGERERAHELHRRLEKLPDSVWRRQSISALAFLDQEDGRFEAAITAYRQLIGAADDELSDESRLMLARCLLEMQRPHEALRELTELGRIRDWQQQPSFLALEGRVRCALGDATAARRAFRAARKAGGCPELDRSILTAACRLHASGKSAAGLELLDEVGEDASIRDEVLYWRGVLTQASGRGDEAIALLQRSLAADDDPTRRYRLADALMRAGRLEEATREFERVVSSGAVDARLRDESRYGLGFCLDALDQEKRAVEVFRSLDRDDVEAGLRNEALFACAECLFELRDWRGAAAIYRRVSAVAGTEKGRQARYKLAFCLDLLAEKEAALKEFLALAAVEPPDELSADCATMAGRIQKELGRLKESAESYARASRLAGSGEQALETALAAASIRRADGDVAGALADYRRLAEGAGKTSALVAFGVAACATELGEQELAAASWGVFVARFPDHELAEEGRINWAWALRALQKRPAALETLTQPMKSAELEPERLFLGGLILEELDRAPEALRAYRACARAAADGPRFGAALLAAALIGRKLGEREAAIEDLDRLLAGRRDLPERAAALHERATLALEDEHLGQARELLGELEGMAGAGPLRRDAVFRLAELDYAAARHPDAIRRYGLLIESADAEPELVERCLFKRGFAREAGGDLKNALADFRRLENAQASFACDALFQAGDIAVRLGDDATALVLFEHLWKRFPDEELGRAGACRSLIVLGRLGRRRDVLDLASRRLRLEARDAWSLRAMATLADAGLAEKERRAARAVYEIVADHGEAEPAARARFMIARCLELEERADDAVDAYLAVTIFHDEAAWSARALLGAAEVLAGQAEPKKALALLRDLLREHPDAEVAPRARELERRLEAEKEER